MRQGVMLCFLLMLGLMAQAQKPLVHSSKTRLSVAEPSDIVWLAERDSFLVVSDNGLLYTVSKDGLGKRKVFDKATDLEALAITQNEVLAIDESERRINRFDRSTLAWKGSMIIPYAGARNKGYEAAAFDPATGLVYLITEKQPMRVLTLDSTLRVVNTRELDKMADVSAATWHNGALWVLSDEDRTLARLKPDLSIDKKWKLKVHNPEGFCFGPKGELFVLSDDMELMFRFEPSTLN